MRGSVSKREDGQKGWLAPGEGGQARGAGLIQNGPRTAALASDPGDTPGVAACEGAGWGAGLLLQHPLKAPPCRRVQRPGGRGRQPPPPPPPLPPPPPELVPLVPLSVLVLLGSWVLQVRDIGKVILFREP